MTDHKSILSPSSGQPLAIKLDVVQAKTALHKTGVYARLDPSSHLHDETFPQPFSYQTGRGVFWVAEEIDAWVASQIERSRARGRKPTKGSQRTEGEAK